MTRAPGQGGRRLAALAVAAALALGLSLAAVTGCGGPQRAPDAPPPPRRPAAGDPRTPIERRRDAACDRLGPKLTACAVADTRDDLAAGKIDQREFERLTAPEWQDKLTARWLSDCKGARYSSRQVRVLEVCFREETECDPLLQCLEHLHDQVRGSRGK